MSQYDTELSQYERDAADAKQEIDALQATVFKNNNEINECKTEIGFLNKEKQNIENQLRNEEAKQHAGNNVYRIDQQQNMQGVNNQDGPSATEKKLNERMKKIDAAIFRLNERIKSLEGETSTIQSRDIPQAQSRLNAAVNKLNELYPKNKTLGKNYDNTYRGIKQESAYIKTKPAKSYLDKGAGIAHMQYQNALRREKHIENVLRIYGSNISSSNSGTPQYCGQYKVNINVGNSHSQINKNTLDNMVLNNNSDQGSGVGGSLTIFDRIFKENNPISHMRYQNLIQQPRMYPGGIITKYQTPFSNINYH